MCAPVQLASHIRAPMLRSMNAAAETKPKPTLPGFKAQAAPMTKEEKIDNINEFFEELFKSIDYSILLIFMGK